ncbi:MAG: hypothetical protein EXS31_14060 [Pedosphaera sp.]|nr:hypothetical protein [Pedosphaera sp.]
MTTRTVELELDAVEKLEAAKQTPDESFSDVVRRAQMTSTPHTACELLEEFVRRAGNSPLSNEALDRLAEAQRNPRQASSHWRES